MAENGVELKNIKEFQRLFRGMEDRLQRRVSRSALKASAKPIIKQMKSNLKRHRRTGNLQRSIKAESLKKGRAGKQKEVVIIVGAIKNRNVSFLPDGFYARFLEMGTSKQPPRPWARPALDSTLNQQRQKLAEEYGARGLKEINRQARRIIGR